MDQFADIVVISLWGLIFVGVWSLIGMTLTAAAIGFPALLGWWRLARACAWLLVVALALLWLSALAEFSWPFPLPTRRHAVPFVLPILAVWPALAALLITRFHLAPRTSGETP